MESCHHLLPGLRQVAVQAAEIAREAREALRHELKADGSIVTNADRAIETYLREELPQLAKGSTVWGEEFGFEEEGTGGLWVVDPIDGTSNFTFGSPIWGISIGLVRGKRVEAGVIYLPDLDEMYLAARGHGVTCNGEQLPPIPAGAVKPEELVSYNDSVIRAYGLQQIPYKMRCSGAVVIDAAFVARQRYRGFIGFRESLYDFAVAMLMGWELGADVRYADGDPIDIEAIKRPMKMGRAWLIFPAESGFHLPRL